MPLRGCKHTRSGRPRRAIGGILRPRRSFLLRPRLCATAWRSVFVAVERLGNARARSARFPDRGVGAYYAEATPGQRRCTCRRARRRDRNRLSTRDPSRNAPKRRLARGLLSRESLGHCARLRARRRDTHPGRYRTSSSFWRLDTRCDCARDEQSHDPQRVARSIRRRTRALDSRAQRDLMEPRDRRAREHGVRRLSFASTISRHTSRMAGARDPRARVRLVIASPFASIALLAALTAPFFVWREAASGRVAWAAFGSPLDCSSSSCPSDTQAPSRTGSRPARRCASAAPAIAAGTVVLASLVRRIAPAGIVATALLLAASTLFGVGYVLAIFWNDSAHPALRLRRRGSIAVASVWLVSKAAPGVADRRHDHSRSPVAVSIFLAGSHPVDYLRRRTSRQRSTRPGSFPLDR